MPTLTLPDLLTTRIGGLLVACRPGLRRGAKVRLLARAAVLCVTCWSAPGAVFAEKADRTKPMVVESDQGGTVDLQRQVLVYKGNVVITQGTMLLRADRIEMRETPDGYRTASALGAPGKPATWRQKRDGIDETMEGSADRIDFDGRSDTLRFQGNGTVRRLRGAALADEITGAVIVWDNTNEVFRVEGGAPSALNPGGRVRAVLSPRVEAASAPAASMPPKPGAQAPGSLQPSRTLGTGR
jgi:lipopolysaccharide export system protein LptA